jgi:ABC-type phosphate transport system auxiliary subunit
MKTKCLIVLLVAFFVGFTTFSYAAERDHRDGNAHENQRIQGLDQRLRSAHEGINRGMKYGSLTREEAHRLNRELDNVRDDEARMRADGKLTRNERERLGKELNRLERHISQLKQNDNKKDHDHRR